MIKTILDTNKVIGIVTLENVLEKILQLDILDEEDKDLSKFLNRKATMMYPDLALSQTSVAPHLVHNASSTSAILRPSDVKFAEVNSSKSAVSAGIRNSNLDQSSANRVTEAEVQNFVTALTKTIRTKVKSTMQDEDTMAAMRAESVNVFNMQREQS